MKRYVLGEANLVFERLLGIEMKGEQYRLGRAFCDTVSGLTDEPRPWRGCGTRPTRCPRSLSWRNPASGWHEPFDRSGVGFRHESTSPTGRLRIRRTTNARAARIRTATVTGTTVRIDIPPSFDPAARAGCAEASDGTPKSINSRRSFGPAMNQPPTVACIQNRWPAGT